MSAAEIETHEAGTARRDLILADIAIVQKQNINWLSRRFGFRYELDEYLSSRGAKALGLGLSRLDQMPTWGDGRRCCIAPYSRPPMSGRR